MMIPKTRLSLAAVLLVCGAAGCSKSEAPADTTKSADGSAASSAAGAPCAGDNGGITLPPGFCATVFADNLGQARHIVVAANGDVYVNTQRSRRGPADQALLVALRDTNHDGRADVVQRFGTTSAAGGRGGTGIGLFDNHVYAEDGANIVRYALTGGALVPSGAPETVIRGLPTTGDHPYHPFVIDPSGTMYMNSGSPSNSCQVRNRTQDSPGRRPCPELETRAGIWKYDAKQLNQTFSPAQRYATGIRNAIGLAFAPGGQLYATQHGRDQLADNWPKLYTSEQGQNLPAEELLKITQGADYGWPYCYFDNTQQKLVLAPEYGGDGGTKVGECAQKTAPVAFFPAHWAPNGLVFYTGSQFPQAYRGGAFIAFHGSWNRAPGPQQGYQVVFVPFANGAPSVKPGQFDTFANGFAGGSMTPDRAAHRPVGLALGPDGALFITDDQGGRVWRVTYTR
jgi:glucose/arabinose dehydrogenase